MWTRVKHFFIFHLVFLISSRLLNSSWKIKFHLRTNNVFNNCQLLFYKSVAVFGRKYSILIFFIQLVVGRSSRIRKLFWNTDVIHKPEINNSDSNLIKLMVWQIFDSCQKSKIRYFISPKFKRINLTTCFNIHEIINIRPL